MLSSSTREVRLPLAWQFIERVRTAVAEALLGQPEELTEGAVMCASELAENIVKYGLPLDGEDSGKISIGVESGEILLRSESGAAKEDAERVLGLVGEIAGCDDLAGLYMRRLSEMSTLPREAPTELGLLRIALEGDFKLLATFRDGRLTIDARRRFS